MAKPSAGGAAAGRLWLVAAGILALLLVHLALGQYLGRTMTEKLLTREGEVTQEFLNSILAAELSADQLFTQPAPSPALQSFSAHVRSLPGIVRANIYSPDGYIRHSTEANLVGVHFSDNDELAESFKGKITSVLEELGGSGKSEHIALNQMEGDRVIEAYIPVLSPDGKVAAVVEFYRRDDWLQSMAETISRSIWIAAALSILILAGVTMLAMRSGTRKS